MTIKNAALISLIGLCVHSLIWFCEIIYRSVQWGFDGWTILQFLYLILFSGSFILFLSVVFYNHHKKEKMNQSHT